MRASRWITFGLLAALAIMVLAILPRSRSLPGGYTYTYFPRGGHRYIIAPGGIKKVGQEVLSYRVDGPIVSGTVRRQLGRSEIRTFRLDTTTHQVTLGEADAKDAR
jgi:hypothetical protein